MQGFSRIKAELSNLLSAPLLSSRKFPNCTTFVHCAIQYLAFSTSGSNAVGLSRFNVSTGEPDLTFGTNGLIDIDNPVTHGQSISFDSSHSVAISEDGGKLYFGWTCFTGNSDFTQGVVVRLD